MTRAKRGKVMGQQQLWPAFEPAHWRGQSGQPDPSSRGPPVDRRGLAQRVAGTATVAQRDIKWSANGVSIVFSGGVCMHMGHIQPACNDSPSVKHTPHTHTHTHTHTPHHTTHNTSTCVKNKQKKMGSRSSFDQHKQT